MSSNKYDYYMVIGGNWYEYRNVDVELSICIGNTNSDDNTTR